MSSSQNRKNPRARLPRQPIFNPSVLALAALAMPVMGHAQQVRSGDQALPEIKVQTTTESPYKAERVSSPKLTQPLVDTPQTISVVKKELLQEQGATNLMEALRNTPGITMQLGENGNTSAGDTFQMRGVASQSSIFVDGVRDLGAVTRDAFNIEQIEIVKGPAGSDIGRGASSGYVNLVTKVPTLENANNGTIAVGTGDVKRATADLNRKIGETSAFRLNFIGQDSGVDGRDHVRNQSIGIAPSLAFGLGTPTRVYFYTQHMRTDNVPDGGVPTIGLNGFYNASAAAMTAPRVDSSNFYGSNNDYEKVDADMATARIEHDLGNGVVVRNITRYGRSTLDRITTGVNALTVTGPMSTWSVSRSRQRLYQENEIFANQTNVTAEVTTGALQHSLTGGVELSHESQKSPTYALATGVTAVNANLYNPNSGEFLPTPVQNGARTNGDTTTAAIYLSDTIRVGSNWLFSGGVRTERYDTSTDAVSLSTAAANPTLPVGTLIPANLEKKDNITSWKLGVVYKPAHNGSVYAAYANSYTPPGSANFALSATAGNVNGPSLAPQKAINSEIGTKWDLLDKKLSLTAAVYRTDLTNELTLLDTATNTYGQLGKRRVEGVELGLVGQITPVWNISAGVATMDTKVLEGTTGNTANGAATRWSPDLTATLWTTYKLANGLTIGGGARYVSEQKRTVDPTLPLATQNNPSIPSYWVADALVSYTVNKNITLQLNVFNVFDKFYVNSLNNGGSRYIPGVPRSALLTANLAF